MYVGYRHTPGLERREGMTNNMFVNRDVLHKELWKVWNWNMNRLFMVSQALKKRVEHLYNFRRNRKFIEDDNNYIYVDINI